MPLEAKVNGKPIAYSPSPLERVYERLSLTQERNFYTKKDGNITRVNLHPAYRDRDTFKYRANIFNDGRDITFRLEHPKREVLEICTLDYKGKITIERDLQWGRILVKKKRKNKKIELRKRFGLEDIDALEKYVRRLY